jgi:hypothetical protein
LVRCRFAVFALLIEKFDRTFDGGCRSNTRVKSFSIDRNAAVAAVY